ncbi:hypothetical protein FH972_023181 [Carpinus fangiana]|uniref:DUF7726 domain-containing protein n=1 Tax=Carpinus fangiana TaxID=176857 RepID=A0A5N6KWQ2_9ROSI|nr:hypothetical protein FH972_023181 [Carpinus fangiana]
MRYLIAMVDTTTSPNAKERGVLEDITGNKQNETQSTTSNSAHNEQNQDNVGPAKSKQGTKGADSNSIEEDPRRYVPMDELPEYPSLDYAPMQDHLKPNNVRTKLRRLLDSGAVTQTKLLQDFQVSANSFRNFMGHSDQMGGMGTDTYLIAYEYFCRRDLAGLKDPNPNAKKRKSDSTDAPASKKTKKSGSALDVNLADITLADEETREVACYDLPREVRRKINAHLKSGVTQADLLRQLTALNGGKKLQSKQLNDFRAFRTPDGGNMSAIYYTAYIYFEKLRIKEGKPKSSHRLDVEAEHPGGFDRSRQGPSAARFFIGRNETVSVDSMGKPVFHSY